MRCLSCKYDLSHLTEHRCPECGRAFDPNDPATLAGQPFPWGAFLFRTTSSYVILLLWFAYHMTALPWPWRHRDLLYFRNVAIFLFVPLMIANLLTHKWSLLGWLMALLLAGFFMMLFFPGLAR